MNLEEFAYFLYGAYASNPYLKLVVSGHADNIVAFPTSWSGDLAVNVPEVEYGEDSVVEVKLLYARSSALGVGELLRDLQQLLSMKMRCGRVAAVVLNQTMGLRDTLFDVAFVLDEGGVVNLGGVVDDKFADEIYKLFFGDTSEC